MRVSWLSVLVNKVPLEVSDMIEFSRFALEHHVQPSQQIHKKARKPYASIDCLVLRLNIDMKLVMCSETNSRFRLDLMIR